MKGVAVVSAVTAEQVERQLGDVEQTRAESVSDAFERAVHRVAGELNRWHAELVALTGRLVEEELWGGGGFRSPEHWLTVRAGLSPARAHDVVVVARRRKELPTISRQLTGGLISIDQAVVVAKYAPASHEASVGGFTPLATVTQLRRSLTRYAFADPTAAAASPDPAPHPAGPACKAGAEGDHVAVSGPNCAEAGPVARAAGDPGADAGRDTQPAPSQVEPSEVAPSDGESAPGVVGSAPGVVEPAPGVVGSAPGVVGPGGPVRGAGAAFGTDPWSPAGQAGRAGELSVRYDDGRFILHANLPAADGALVEQALREAKDALIASGTSSAVTLADALVEIADRSLATLEPVSSRASRYRVYVHLDTSGAWVNARGAIPAHLAARYACIGDPRAVWERDGQPVNVGRTQRAVPDRLRRLVEDRDRGCAFPGCTATTYVEIHHVEHWADGGPTDYDRLISLCCWHHDAHHRGDYAIEAAPGRPGQFTFRNKRGPIHAGPPPGATTADGPSQLGGGPAVGDPVERALTGDPYSGPTGERLSLNWVMFYDNDTYYGQTWSPPRPDPTIDP